MSYRRKHLNPRIKNLRPKKRIWKSPIFWVGILLLVLAIGSIYLVFFWSKFQIQSIQISGNVKADSKEIESLAFEHIQKKFIYVSHKSIFITDTKKITSDILQKFPVIENVDVGKNYPDSLRLDIVERDQFAVFCGQQNKIKCFSIDKNGIIFEPLKDLPDNMLVLIPETTNKEFLPGESAIGKNIMDAINNIQIELKDNFQIDIKEAFVSDPLIVRTSENWKLYFDPDGDIQSQITKMNLMLKDQITPNARKNLQYIYLQYKDRAYYK